MRPESYRTQVPPRRCGNCVYGLRPEYKDHRLCFCGDTYVTQPSFSEDGKTDVLLDGEAVGLLDGDAYDRVWGGRVVDDDDVCDCWLPNDGPTTVAVDAIDRAREIVAANEWSGDMRANMTKIIGAGRVLARALALRNADVHALQADIRAAARPGPVLTPVERDSQSELERFADWVLARVADCSDGCLTGDCPHDTQRKCVASLLNRFGMDRDDDATGWVEDETP